MESFFQDYISEVTSEEFTGVLKKFNEIKKKIREAMKSNPERKFGID